MDEVICCLLGICCPPFSAEHREAFESQLALHFDNDAARAKEVCDATYETFAHSCKKLADHLEKQDRKKNG